jgi:hypothetical protein
VANRFSFQIGSTAKFTWPMPSLWMALGLGKSGRLKPPGSTQTAAMPPRIPKSFGQIRRGQTQSAPRRALPASWPRPAAAAKPAPAARPPVSVPLGVGYRGRLIRAVQLGDRRWVASHAPIDGGYVLANGPPPLVQEGNVYLTRFMAIAGAELEIDETQPT